MQHLPVVVKSSLAATLLLALTACGGDEEQAAPTTSAPPPAPTTSAPPSAAHLCVLSPEEAAKPFAAYRAEYRIEPGTDMDGDGTAEDCTYAAAEGTPQPRLRTAAYEPGKSFSMSTADEYGDISADSFDTVSMQACPAARKPLKKGFRPGFCQKYRGNVLVLAADGTVGWLFTPSRAIGLELEGVEVGQGRPGYLAASKRFLRLLAENQPAA